MPPTSVSLLERLRGQPGDADWQRLVAVYTPFIRRWLRDPALAADAEDLLQEVLTTLVREVPRFRRQRDGSFRAWLRVVTAHHVATWHRRNKHHPAGGTENLRRLADLSDPDSRLSRQWDREHDEHVMARLLELLRGEFSADTWEAFERQVVRAESAAAVAAGLGKSVNAVLLAKSRVLTRLRVEADGLI